MRETAGVIEIDGSALSSWSSFHDVFKTRFGFPDFYGRNMDAWIDCMISLDSPDDALSRVHVPKGSVLTLQIARWKDFKSASPEICDALVECSAFVNWRRIETGEPPVLALSFHK